MKVLLFTDSDVFAGTERHILDLAAGLRDLRVELLIAGPRPGALVDRAIAMGIEVLAVAKGGHYDRRAIAAVAGLFRSGRIDLVHVHNGRTALIAALAVSRAGRGRCVMTQHFMEPSHVRRRGLSRAASNLVHNWIDCRVSQYVANSAGVRESMISRGEASSDRVTVVHNGINDPQKQPMRGVEAIRADFGVVSSAPLIACASRFEMEKDVPTLIAAMGRIAGVRPDAVCVIAGDGSQRTLFERQIAVAGLGRNVLLPGFRSDVLELMHAADLFVLPSPVEGFGLSLVEAMALCRPVVAIRAGGPTEIVCEGETGILVPPRDSERMAQEILRLLDNPAARTSMGKAGRARYLERFTAGRMAAATLEVYEQVMASDCRGVNA